MRPRHPPYHVYAITAWGGSEPLMRGDEHSEIRWFPVADALALDLALSAYRDVLRCL